MRLAETRRLEYARMSIAINDRTFSRFSVSDRAMEQKHLKKIQYSQNGRERARELDKMWSVYGACEIDTLNY